MANDNEVPRPDSRNESYADDCAVDEDCVVVSFASCALCGSCGDLAIARREQARFDGDNVIFGCPARDAIASCGACPELRAACVDARCAVVDCEDGVCD